MRRPDGDMVDAEFKVTGPDGEPVEHHVPRREPVIKSWTGLVLLILMFGCITAVSLWRQERQYEKNAIRLQEFSTPDTSAPAPGSAPLAGSSAAPGV